MITIKTATYSREELVILTAHFGYMVSKFDCRSLGECPRCEYRVLCNDIHSTHEYLKRKVGESE